MVRALRLLNVAAGIAIAGLALVADAPTGFAVAVVVTGLLVAALSVPRGEIAERYGDWHLLTR